jgi:hypothetical protein
LVAAQRFAAFRAVVDDRFGITGQPIPFGQSDVVVVVAIARPLLAAAIESTEAVVDWLQRFIDELRICLHGAGAADLLALRHIGVTPIQ